MLLERLAWSMVIVGAAMLSGCQHGESQTSERPTVSVNGRTDSADRNSAPPIEQTIKSDPCAARLHEISGAMLEYFAFHNSLPKRLEDLRTLTDLERPLNFVCPITGKDYTYVPNGLRSKVDSRQIILFDTDADGRGQRWVIMMQPPQGRQPAAMWVIFLTEPIFNSYVSVSSSRPSTRSTTIR